MPSKGISNFLEVLCPSPPQPFFPNYITTHPCSRIQCPLPLAPSSISRLPSPLPCSNFPPLQRHPQPSFPTATPYPQRNPFAPSLWCHPTLIVAHNPPCSVVTVTPPLLQPPTIPPPHQKKIHLPLSQSLLVLGFCRVFLFFFNCWSLVCFQF